MAKQLSVIQKVKDIFSETLSRFMPVNCVVCGQIIIGSYTFDSWNQAAHDFHKVSLCFSCGRIIAKNGLVLADSRQLCEHCQPSVVKTVQQIEWVEKKVRAILSKAGFDDIPQNVPIEIVDYFKLMKIQGNKARDLNQRGLAISNQTICNGIKNTEHKVYILDYLPKIEFAGVFAHEMLHVWQNDKGIRPPIDICEGFCNLGSYAVFSDINNPAAIIYIEKMDKNPDPIYGEGYRKVKRHLDKNGWQSVIGKIKNS
jgi:hypothetical protein